jgi:hypothetical protein
MLLQNCSPTFRFYNKPHSKTVIWFEKPLLPRGIALALLKPPVQKRRIYVLGVSYVLQPPFVPLFFRNNQAHPENSCPNQAEALKLFGWNAQPEDCKEGPA